MERAPFLQVEPHELGVMFRWGDDPLDFALVHKAAALDFAERITRAATT